MKYQVWGRDQGWVIVVMHKVSTALFGAAWYIEGKGTQWPAGDWMGTFHLSGWPGAVARPGSTTDAARPGFLIVHHSIQDTDPSGKRLCFEKFIRSFSFCYKLDLT